MEGIGQQLVTAAGKLSKLQKFRLALSLKISKSEMRDLKRYENLARLVTVT